MTRDRIVPDRRYYVRQDNLYAVSPDGVGVYWYDTMADMISSHGTGPIHSISHIEDF
jgi:hypothetical protein